MDTIEPAQTRILEQLAKRLKATPTVFNLTGPRITVDEAVSTDLPRIVVLPGKHRPAPQSDVAVLRQCDVKVRIEAADEAGLMKLAGIVRKAIASSGFEVDRQKFICGDTGEPKDDAELGYWTVTDTWSTFHVQSPAD